jgi:uncharacterized protein (TIGR03382 family)
MRTLLPFALALVVVSLFTPAHAFDPGAMLPPMSRQPNRDASPYFEPDPRAPGKFIPSKKVRALGGLGREQVEALTRPPLDPAVLDEIEAVKGKRYTTIHPPGLAPSPMAVTQSGNVLILQGNDLTVNTQNGTSFDHNNGFFEVANTVLSRYGDNFDFISVWTTFPDQNVAAYYFPLKNDTQGLGDCNFQAGETFGCEIDQTGGALERLQGLVFMNSVSMWQEWDRQFDGATHDLTSFDSACYSTLGQEIAHRWGSGLRFKDENGNTSTKLLGRDNSHWAAWLDTGASVMDGWDWEEDGDRFELINDMDVYSDLDLYTIGALGPGEVRPFFYIANAKYQESAGVGINGRNIGKGDVLELGLPSVSLMEEYGIDMGATGTRVDVTMQDVLDVEGMRCPDPDHTERAFKQAFVLITRPGESEAQAQDDADELEIVEDTWEKWWHDRTAKAVTLCSVLEDDCAHAVAQLSGLDIPDADIGGDGKQTIKIAAKDATVKNAKLTLTLSGVGADSVELKKSEFDLGDIGAGDAKEVVAEFSVDDGFECGTSFVIDAKLESDNAKTELEHYRVLPGYRIKYENTFKDDEDGFKVNADGKDGAGDDEGGLVFTSVAMSCEMSPRTAERDNSPNDSKAFVTKSDLDGDTSLWSKEIDLEGAVDPVIRYAYWLDGEGSLTVQLSRDGGDTFKNADVFKEPGHSWAQGTANLHEIFGDELPESVVARFIFAGNGKFAGGVDDFRVVDVDGVCLEQSKWAGCGCNASGSGAPPALFAVLATIGLALRRRRS